MNILLRTKARSSRTGAPARRSGPAVPRVAFRAACRVLTGAAVVLSLSACGGGGEPATPPTPSAAQLSAAQPGQLLTHVRGLLRQRWSARQNGSSVLLDRFASPALAATAGAADASAIAQSGTRVQEPGIDEPDLLKADGPQLFALDAYSRARTTTPGLQLQVARLDAAGRLETLQALPLPGEAHARPHGLLVSPEARRLLVLSERLLPVGLPMPCPPGLACAAADSMIYPPTALQARIDLQAADYAADGHTTLRTRLSIDGSLVGSRRVGNSVLLVTTHTPQLAADQLPTTASASDREAALAALRTADLLPQLRVDDGPAQPLVQETDCLLQPASRSLSITVTTVVRIDLGSPALPRQALCFLGGTEALYLAAQGLYLVTTRSALPVLQPDGSLRYPDEVRTDIHRWTWDGDRVRYRASGDVAGHLGWDPLRMALRLSEHAGDLRVLSYTGSKGWGAVAEPGRETSPATLTVLREDAASARLVPLATLPNTRRPALLGKPGEQIYGVRFAGARAYLVTYRQTDPLYVLDLSDPADPRTAGELEMPGFSDVLQPLGTQLLFGVGRDATPAGQALGVKLALFDVGDPARPALLASQVLGGPGSYSALELSPHGLNLLPTGTGWRLALPIVLNQPGQPAVDHALHRFEIDAASRRLIPRPPVPAPASETPWDLSGDRSLQIGPTLVYLSQGRLLSTPW